MHGVADGLLFGEMADDVALGDVLGADDSRGTHERVGRGIKRKDAKALREGVEDLEDPKDIEDGEDRGNLETCETGETGRTRERLGLICCANLGAGPSRLGVFALSALA